jgi:hypothetical protein
MNIFTYLQCLLSGNMDQYLKAEELNNIYKTFKGKYHYISKERTIQSAFLNKVWTLFSQLKNIKQLLEQTIFDADEHKALAFLTYTAQNFLPPEIKKQADNFFEDTMKSRIENADSQAKMIKTIDAEFSAYKNEFTQSNMAKFNSEYIFVHHLYGLASFDYETFFRVFDRGFNANLNNPPSYSSVNGKDIIDDLKDLYYLIAIMPNKTDITAMLTILYQRMSQGDAKSHAKIGMNAVNQIYKLINDDLSSDKLMNLCKYVSEDTSLKIPLDRKVPNPCDRVRRELEDRYHKSRDKIVAAISEHSMEEEIQGLFKKIPLQKIDKFDPEINDKLAKAEYKTIANIQALRVSKTFIISLYEPKMKEAFNLMILEGLFSDKEYQKQLSEQFYELNELRGDFAEAEADIASGTYSFTSLETFLAKAKGSNNPQVIKIIDGINKKIAQQNQIVYDCFVDFGKQLYEILQDYKKQKSFIITNIKQIKGVQNKEFITQLVAAYNDIVKYCKIMKPFVRQRRREEE